jgi:hypothetical protein
MSKKLIKNIIYPIVKSPPDFLIIGAQKAGTTSLYHYLKVHPNIFGNLGFKEVRYFDRPEHYNLGFSWYLGNFPSKFTKGNKLTCDASPNYLYYDFVPERIKNDLGENIKMIAVLREPVSRAYSAWQMFHSFENIDNDHLRRFYDSRSFSEAIKEELTPNSDYNQYPFRYDYIDRGKYAQQIKHYYKYFKKENLLIIKVDDFRENLFSVLEKICYFLEIKPFSTAEVQKLQATKYNEGKYYFEKSIEDKETLEYLKDYYRPYNKELSDLLGSSYNWES